MWDERYAQDDYVFGTEPAAFLAALTASLQAGQRTLVVADGEGRNSVFLAEHGLDVTATDASPVGIAKARRLAEERGVAVQFELADLLTRKWEPDAYDIVVGIFIQFMGPDDRTNVFGGIQRTLRSGGRLLLHGYRIEQLAYGTGGPPIAENMYTEELLAASFPELETERLVAYDTEIAEGTGHVGMSALIDYVGHKR
jgi:cyclopropane fatty-acyl-phospholipid synthase-like methyltransferase